MNSFYPFRAMNSTDQKGKVEYYRDESSCYLDSNVFKEDVQIEDKLGYFADNPVHDNNNSKFKRNTKKATKYNGERRNTADSNFGSKIPSLKGLIDNMKFTFFSQMAKN